METDSSNDSQWASILSKQIGELRHSMEAGFSTVDSKMSTMNSTITDIKVDLRGIDERTKGDNRSSQATQEISWKFITIAAAIAALVSGLMQYVVKK